MKKITLSILALALLAFMAAPAMAVVSASTSVTVTITVTSFVEVTATGGALAFSVNGPEFPGPLPSQHHGQTTFGLRCNTVASLTIDTAHEAETTQSGGTTGGGFWPTARTAGGTDGIGYGLSCSVGGKTGTWDNVTNHNVVVSNIPAGVYKDGTAGVIDADSYMDSTRVPLAGPPKPALAPPGTYSGTLVLTVSG